MNNNNKVKFEFCKYGDRCFKGPLCTFAHSLEELKPLMCEYYNCSKLNCFRMHKDDSIIEYCKKRNYKIPEKKTEKTSQVPEKKTEKIKLC